MPAGVLPLVDPAHVPTVDSKPGDGTVVMVDEDPFLPMPVNDRQLQILRRVDTHAQTLVQGPPGTGKRHTAAALISHLLAQGKRVLVTAHTDRALKEVRASPTPNKTVPDRDGPAQTRTSRPRGSTQRSFRVVSSSQR